MRAHQFTAQTRCGKIEKAPELSSGAYLNPTRPAYSAGRNWMIDGFEITKSPTFNLEGQGIKSR
jgi:hypothetical protein